MLDDQQRLRPSGASGKCLSLGPLILGFQDNRLFAIIPATFAIPTSGADPLPLLREGRWGPAQRAAFLVYSAVSGFRV